MIDPTDDPGGVPSETTNEMALVGEPRDGMMPSSSPLNFRYGHCRDREHPLGVAFYATRALAEGDEAAVCFGPHVERAYRTACSNTELLGRWTELQERLLRPLISSQRGI